MPRAYELYLQDIVKATKFLKKQVPALNPCYQPGRQEVKNAYFTCAQRARNLV